MGQPNRIISAPAPKLGIPNTSQHVFAAPSDPWMASTGGRATMTDAKKFQKTSVIFEGWFMILRKNHDEEMKS